MHERFSARELVRRKIRRIEEPQSQGIALKVKRRPSIKPSPKILEDHGKSLCVQTDCDTADLLVIHMSCHFDKHVDLARS